LQGVVNIADGFSPNMEVLFRLDNFNLVFFIPSTNQFRCMIDWSVTDIVLPSISAGLFLIYHAYFFLMYFFAPQYTNLGIQVKTRKHWLYTMLFTPGQEVLAIQTLRNAIMSASFFASIASGLAFYMMTLSQKGTTEILTSFQYLLLASIFFTSFLFFAFNVRSNLHLGFLITAKNMDEVRLAIKLYRHDKVLDAELEESKQVIDIEKIGKIDSMRLQNLDKAARHMTLAAIYYTLGVRTLYLAVPVAFWVSLGSWAMFSTTFLVLSVLIMYDHV
jgi:uncharacterized membrane protein